MLWVLDCLTEVASDLSVFHRINDANGLEAAVFFALAQRLPVYSGAVAAWFATVLRHTDTTEPVAPEPVTTAPPEPPPATAAVLTQLNGKFASLGMGPQFSVAAVSPDA